MVVLLAIIADVFIPVFSGNPVLGFIIFLIKTLILLFILTVIKSVNARLRIEQMVQFCWMVLAPLALVQLLIDIIAKGAIA